MNHHRPLIALLMLAALASGCGRVDVESTSELEGVSTTSFWNPIPREASDETAATVDESREADAFAEPAAAMEPAPQEIERETDTEESAAEAEPAPTTTVVAQPVATNGILEAAELAFDAIFGGDIDVALAHIHPTCSIDEARSELELGQEAFGELGIDFDSFEFRATLAPNSPDPTKGSATVVMTAYNLGGQVLTDLDGAGGWTLDLAPQETEWELIANQWVTDSNC